MTESHQLRKSPRRPTVAQAVLRSGEDSFEGVITDLSADGAFIRTGEGFHDGDQLGMEIGLPTGGNALRTRARVVRAGSGGVGVRFEEMSARSRSRLRSYSGYYETDETIVHLQRLLGDDLPSSLLPLGEQDEINAIFTQAVDQDCEMMLFEEVRSSPVRQTCRIEKLDEKGRVWDLDSGILHLGGCERPVQSSSKSLYIVFSSGPLFYAFEAIVLSAGLEPTVLIPERIYLSERRSQPRLARATESWIRFPGNGSNGAIRLSVSDLTDHGASLLVPTGSLVIPGMRFPAFDLHDKEQTRRIEGATVRYVAASSAEEMRVGLSFEAIEEAGRDSFAQAVTRKADRRWIRQLRRFVSVVGGRVALMVRRSSPDDSDDLEVVRYKNDRGDVVAALLDANFDTRDPEITPDVAVVIAPALLKRKELFALLARTVLDNLSATKRRGVVLRFDGSHLVGESTMDPNLVELGKGNFNWTFSHLRSDIEASLEYLSRRFNAKKQALVTVSLASIPARKVILRRADLVDLWVAPFGCPDVQDTMRNYLAGLDLFEQYEAGEGPKTILIHGRDVDGSNLYGEAIASKMAYLADAREDMSRIQIPVTWILGRYDHWVTRSRVRAMLDAPGTGLREIFEFPTGHVVKEGPEAIEVAKVVSETISKHIFQDDRPAVEPNLMELTRQSNLEWSRVGRLKLDDASEFWRQHLFGAAGEGIGYDIMLSHPEYCAFLREQVELMEIERDQRVADFGCGTGNLTVEMAREGGRRGGLRNLTFADVVPEAVTRTREKLETLGEDGSGRADLIGVEVDFERLRLAPIRDFVQGRLFGVRELVGRIEGLTPRIAEKLSAAYGKELHAILRGSLSTAERIKELCPTLSKTECEVVLELSRASRFVLGGMLHEENAPDAGLAPSDEKQVFRYLAFAGAPARPELDFEAESFDRIGASLLVPYLTDARGFLVEVRRLLVPGGIAVVSSVFSNFDPSKLYAEAAQYLVEEAASQEETEERLATLRQFGNSVSRLVELEEDGRFHFHRPSVLESLGKEAGFSDVSVTPAFGSPPVALILRLVK